MHKPSSDSEKVRNTLIEYSTTNRSTLPRVHSRITSAARPMIRMPFCVTRRVDRWRNWCGNQESAAMFDNTDGPPRKPVLAATKSSPASVTNTRSNAA